MVITNWLTRAHDWTAAGRQRAERMQWAGPVAMGDHPSDSGTELEFWEHIVILWRIPCFLQEEMCVCVCVEC